MKAILNRKFIAIRPHFRKTEEAQMNHFMKNLKVFEKKQQSRLKPKVRKEAIKISTENSEIKTKNCKNQ